MNCTNNIPLINDDETTHTTIRRALEGKRYSVGMVCCGLEALPLIEVQEYDLNFYDLLLLEMNGCETFQQLIEMQPYLQDQAVDVSVGGLKDNLDPFLGMQRLPLFITPFSLRDLSHQVGCILLVS